MINSRLVEDLSVAPPQEWARLVRQSEILDYFLEAEVGVAAAAVAAKQLNVTIRHFYKLLKFHRDRAAGTPPRGSQTGFACSISGVQNRIISEAIDAVGPGGRFAEVYRDVVRRSEDAGAEVPSKTSVRTRFGKGRLAIDLAARFEVRCSVFIDLCGLEIDLIAFDGSVSPATLLVVVDAETTLVPHHKVFIGRPTPIALARELHIGLLARIGTANPTIGATTEVRFALSLLPSCRLNGHTFDRTTKVASLRSGSVARAIFGRKVGRVLTRADPKTWLKQTSIEPVSSLVAEAVIGRHIAERNSKLARGNCQTYAAA